MNATELFKNFIGREEALKGVLRYTLYAPVYYRSNVFEHSLRVSWLVNAIAPMLQSVFGKTFNMQRCTLLALVHDDIEMIIGDIQMGNKAKMTPEQLADVAHQEQEAITVLEQRFSKTVGEYSYAELLHEAIDVSSLEAKFMKYADKFDGFGEALHELYAGNTAMTTNVINEYGTIPTPYEYYIPFLQSYRHQYSELLPLFAQDHPFLMAPEFVDVLGIANSGSPHTSESLKNPVGHPQYDWWKKVVWENVRPEQQNYSIQKEFAT